VGRGCGVLGCWVGSSLAEGWVDHQGQVAQSREEGWGERTREAVA
jgi:hypothetical protein